VTVIPNPGNPVPADHDIKVVIGPEIRNSRGYEMLSAETFYFRTVDTLPAGSGFTNWGAVYNKESDDITVSWAATEGRVEASYRIDNGPVIILSGTGNERIIKCAVNNIHEYAVTLDFFIGDIKSDVREIKIWNVPGMVNSKDNPLTEIKTEADFSAISNDLTKNYALSRNIILESTVTWVPIGLNEGKAFSGKFFGNGHTITLNTGRGMSMFANEAYSGIFGYISNAEIRDLTLVYSGDAGAGGTNDNSIKVFGGLVGRMNGESIINNVIVRGGIVNLKSSAENIYAGGICGYMVETSQIINSYSDINLNIIGESNSIGVIRAGGLTGFISNIPAVASDRLIINNVEMAGNISITKTAQSNSMDSVFLGG